MEEYLYCDYSDCSECAVQDCNFVKNAIEKQIPKVSKFDENNLNICPVCKEHLNTKNSYCPKCGQKIIFK